MSSTRLEIPNKLLESLEHLYQATLAYKTEHTADGLYEELLQKPLRVQRNNTRIDFVDDFETNFALISRAQEKVISSNHINTQVIYAGSLPTPIAKLISCNKLLKTAFAHVINKQKSDTNSNEAERDESSAKKELLINAEKIKICNDTITELDNLKLHAEGILLIGYKNHFNSLITLLHKLEAAPQHYKEEHQADHLYEEALINPCKFLVEAKLDFVQDFLKNCDSLQSHSNDFEE
ncbi:MAG TPA: hypothetical protein VHA13_05295, partial [Gammaproteobacteria bacterium]|nr:hypothetical protein [Gammaproteobacteria bacterium]